MASRNDVTGDKIQTKGILSKEAEDQWDIIFGKKKQSRIDTVGQNGNDGLHYEYELDKSTGDIIKVDSKKLTDAFNGH
jgi:hypothetical protein